MKDADSIISGIEAKLHKLIQLHQQTELEKSELAVRNIESQKTIELQEATIKQLEEDQKKLKISKTIETSKGSLDARLKINELVREIDKCIGLLNK
ncbi:MAG: hypothetical protein K8S00_00925 [Bacteroidales bacterium]|nr:hypothetical protein [Bacteroidales bacterium]